MQYIEHDIKPGIGMGALMLGMTRDEVRELLGDPPEHLIRDYGDGELVDDWDYEALYLSLSFHESDQFRLVSITTSFGWATLRSSRIVGMTEAELLVSIFDGLGPPILEEDLEDSGAHYEWEDFNLSCWVRGGVVESVTVIPHYDDTGQQPLWPGASD